MSIRTGVYPGTFDPVTLGHMDIIRRGAKLVDRLVVGVATNPSKSPMFSLDERMEIIQREVADLEGELATSRQEVAEAAAATARGGGKLTDRRHTLGAARRATFAGGGGARPPVEVVSVGPPTLDVRLEGEEG